MALHARELARCATAAFTRQLQVCVGPSQACRRMPTLSVMSLRGLNSSSHSNSVRTPRSGTSAQDKNTKGAQMVNRANQQRIRIKLAAAANAPNQLEALAKSSPREYGNLTNQSKKPKTDNRPGHVGSNSKKTLLIRDNTDKHGEFKTERNVDTSKNEQSSMNIIQSHLPSEEIYFRPHRNEIVKAKKSNAGKFQKKRYQNKAENAGGLIEPMSKLSRDINQWFNDVMEHLAKAENAAPAYGATKPSTHPRKQQRSTKSNSNSNSRKLSQNDTSKTAKEEGGRTGDALSFTQKNQKKDIEDHQVEKLFPKGENNKHKTIQSSPKTLCEETVPGNAERNLKSQLAALNGELSRQNHEGNAERPQVYGAESSRLQNGSFDTDRPKMMEIRPSLVENSETDGAPLPSAAAWLPYGALPDTPPGIPGSQGAGNDGSRSKPRGPVTGSAASAAVASEILSGSSRHQLVSKAVSSDGIAPNASTVRKQNSLEKGKGFILLNNKDKEREALERKVWLEKTQGAKTPPGGENTSFILVDSEKSSDVLPSRSANSKNILLSDNPHDAVAKRASDKGKRGNTERTQRNISNHGNGNKEKECDKRSGMVEESVEPFHQKSKVKTQTRDVITKPTSVDAEEKRWVDLVQRKLFEIQKAKMVLPEAAGEANKSRQDTGTGQTKNNFLKKESGETNKQGRARNAASGKKNIEARPDVTSNQDGVPEVKKPPSPTSSRDPGVNKVKGSVSDPKPSDGSDAEYERRIGQFINSSMGYEETGESSKITKLFGPLTREQDALLEKARKTGNPRYPEDAAIEPPAQRKDHPKPVPVGELKPEMKSVSKLEKAEKFTDKKSEPTLCVKPEEITTMKKPTPSRSTITTNLNVSNDVGHSDQHSIPLSFNSTRNVTRSADTQNQAADPAFEQSELGLSMLQNKTKKTRPISESSSKETGITQEELTSASQAGISEVYSLQNPCRGTDTDQKLVRPENTKSELKTQAEEEHPIKKATPSHRLSNVHSNGNQIPLTFQHEFLKLQQDKLTRSLIAKQLPGTITQTAKEQTAIPEAHTAGQDPGITEVITAGKHAEPLTPKEPRISCAVSEPSAKENRAASLKTEINKGGTRSRRQPPLENTSSNDLDPFEAWVKTMEDRKPAAADRLSSSLGVVKEDNKDRFDKHLRSTTVKSKDEGVNAKQPKFKKKKKYSRFVEKNSPTDTSVPMYQDAHATYYVPVPPQKSSIGPRSESTGTPERIPLNLKVNAVSQSDQIYNMIKESGQQPRSDVPLASLASPVGRRSKVLTQAGLGTVISNSTGLVDPARMPKLRNLFSSFDGFIAMDAVPVLDEKIAKTSTTAPTTVKLKADQPSVKSSLSCGDGIDGSDFRANLAKEREAASHEARRKLIQEYEKNIEKYERGLELYRSRLRRVRQSMVEKEPPAPESDNPRRHSDL